MNNININEWEGKNNLGKAINEGENNILKIINERKNNIGTISTNSYPIYRIITDYKIGKIFLKPAYQRVYKWDIFQKSKLIESILLGIPLPSIFIYGETVNQYEIIDGLQRISTILEFLGVLKSQNTPWSYLILKPYIKKESEEKFEIIEKLYEDIDKLKDKRISLLATGEFEEAKKINKDIISKEEKIEKEIEKISELKDKVKLIKKEKNGKKFSNLKELSILSDLNDKTFDDLNEELKNAFIYKMLNFTILTSKNNNNTYGKYELFYRLNSGGTKFTPQEIRNSLLIYLAPSVYNILKEKKEEKKFKKILNIKIKDSNNEKDTEYVLRFFALIYFDGEINKIDNVNKFIDSFMWSIINNKTKIDGNIFDETFKILYDVEKENSLKRYNKGNFSGKWMVPGFDAIAGGIGYNILKKNIDIKKVNIEEIKKRIKALWSFEAFNENIKTGWFVEHKLKVALFIGRKLFNLKENFGQKEEEIAEKIDKLLNEKFPKKNK